MEAGSLGSSSELTTAVECAPISVGSLKSILDLLEKRKRYPSSAVFIRHAQKSETVVHTIVKYVPDRPQ